MEVYESRGALRRLMRAHLQQATDDVLASQNTTQFNAFLDSAYLKAFQDCRWVEATTQTTLAVGLAQYKVPYPANTAAGSVLTAAIYDIEAKSYSKLERQIIPVEYSPDQAELLGGTDFTAIQSTPWRFECRGDFIYLDPPPEKPYKIRLEIERSKKFVDDNDISLVDSQLILYWALTMARSREPDEKAIWSGMYGDRLGMLRGWQAAGQKFAMDSSASFDENEERAAGIYGLPNYNRSPTVR